MAQGARPWTQLSEEAGVAPLGTAGLLLDKGKALPGWTLRLLPAGRIMARDAMDESQPGAVHYAVGTGAGPATIELVADQPVDLHREALAPVMVVMTVKFDAVPTAPWTATVKCGEGCGKTIPLPSIANVPVGKWFKLGVALRCFAMSQQETSRVTAPFSIATAGPANFALAQVQLGMVADVTTACPG